MCLPWGHRRCQRIGEMPGIGVAKPEVRPELRCSSIGNYLILYRETDEGAEIVRVVHGTRQWEKLL
ncbi:type II toxin-antitoxin system RelE/ParE family toxin [Ancylobacter sp. Lp-2]|uniref:type II toxin-antitoxin system RelE/ParE family toxin n=1 Tax=Ancylobacter sp. Lp-2 TaxID=2881339 RepID=UPI00351CC9A8|nr:type II toxin-antitoxin system RelE/ParE family toxin [Ancylobacter sp. Lp-2]